MEGDFDNSTPLSQLSKFSLDDTVKEVESLNPISCLVCQCKSSDYDT